MPRLDIDVLAIASQWNFLPSRAVRWLLVILVSGIIGGCERGGTVQEPDGTVRAATFSKSFGGVLNDAIGDAIEIPGGGYAVAGNLGTRLWVAELDNNGNLVWDHVIGAPRAGVRRFAVKAVDQAANGDFCLAGKATPMSADAEDLAVDAYLARINEQGDLLWELTTDSGTWPGFEIRPSEYGLPEALDNLTSVVANDDGSCVAAGPSFAELREQGSGSGGISVTFNGISTIVISASAGQVEWLRRRDASARIYEQGIGAVYGNGVGPVAYVNRSALRNTEGVASVLERDGSVRFSRLLEVPPADRVTAQFTDDPGPGGPQDGRKDDGLLIGIGEAMYRLEHDGQLAWRLNFAEQEILSPEFTDHMIGFVFQSCASTPCQFWAYVEADEPLPVSEQSRRSYLVRLNSSGMALENLPIQDADGNFEMARSFKEVVDGHINILSVTEGGLENSRRSYRVGRWPPLYRKVRLFTLEAWQVADSFGRSDRQTLRYNGGLGNVVAGTSTEVGVVRFVSDDFDGWEEADVVTANDIEGRTLLSTTYGQGYEALRIEMVSPGAYEVWANDSDGLLIATVDASGVIASQRLSGIQAHWRHRDYLQTDSSVLKRNVTGEFVQLFENPYQVRAAWNFAESDDSYLLGIDSYIAITDKAGQVRSSFELDGITKPGQLGFSSGVFAVMAAANNEFITLSFNRSNRTSIVLGRYTADGAVQWIRDFELPDVDFPSLFGLTQGYRGYNFATDMYLAEHANGDIAALMTVGEARQYAVDRGGNPVTGEDGFENLLLLRWTSSGELLQARLFGGGEVDFAFGFKVTADGGYLINGASRSFGDRYEGWLLRLGPDAEVAAGCNADLGTIPVFNFRITDAPEIATPSSYYERYRMPADDPPAPLPATPLVENSQGLAEARQCFGTAAGPGAVLFEPETETVTLTVNQAGSLPGLVISIPSDIRCGVTSGPQFCSTTRVRDSIITLQVDDADSVRFRGWGAECRDIRTNPHRCVVTMDRDKTINVFFEDADGSQVSLTTSVAGDGSISTMRNNAIRCTADALGSDCTENYLTGTPVALEASWGADQRFLGWGDDCSAWYTSQSLQIILDADTHCSVAFEPTTPPTTQPLNVAVLADGVPANASAPGGRVTSTPAGINCGSPGAGCSASFPIGTTVELTATPVVGFQFSRWSSPDNNSGCATSTNRTVTVTVNQALQCNVEFLTEPSAPTLLVNPMVDGLPRASGAFGGVIVSSPAGISCGNPGAADQMDCSENFAIGLQVQLSVLSVQPGYTFVGWSGCSQSVAAAVLVTIASTTECVPQFLSSTTGVSNLLTINFDAPASGARVVSVNSSLIDCTSSCFGQIPISSSPIQLRPVEEGATWTGWVGCDAELPDPAMPSGPRLCQVDLSVNSKTVTVVYSL